MLAPAAFRQPMEAPDPGHSDAVVTEVAARALKDVAQRIARHEEEEGRIEEISRWVHETAQEFTDAPVQIYVPILVENIVRARLRAATMASTHQDEPRA